MSDVFTHKGKAFVKNASGRITDIPASQLEIFVAQGYKPCTEEEVEAVSTFKHVFDGNFGQNAKVDPDTLEAMNKLQAGQVAQIAERLSDGSDILHGELMIGAEPHPPMTSRTRDGFPRLQEAGLPHVGLRPSAQPAAPTLQRGQVPDNLREAIGRVSVGGSVKDPEQAIKDGDVKVVVTAPVNTVSVAARPGDSIATASVAAARAVASEAAQPMTTTQTMPTTAGGTVTVVRSAVSAVDNTPTLEAVAVASAVAAKKAKQDAQSVKEVVENAEQVAADAQGGRRRRVAPVVVAPVEPEAPAPVKPEAPAPATAKADDAVPTDAPHYAEIQADGRIKTVADLKEFDFANDKIAGIADKGIEEVEAYRDQITVE